jgi:hypothetical protein
VISAPGLLAFVPGAGAPAGPETQQTGGGRTRTEHLQVTYPEGAEDELRVFLGYAEEVYAGVDSLLGGALPAPLSVALVTGTASGSSPGGIVLGLERGLSTRVVFARELARAAQREILGETYELPGYRFFEEGVAAWVEERYERDVGRVKPRGLWAAYAYMQEATYPEYLAAYEGASEELGREVATAAGHSFVSYLIDIHGQAGLMALMKAMSENVDICSALDSSGIGCARFVEAWQEALALEAEKYDFTAVPDVFADLEMSGEGEYRDLSLRVFIRNPETVSYLFFVSYIVDGERSEESYRADSSDFEALVPLGRVRVGTKVLWDVAVWSRTLETWKKSGWQDRIVR